MSVDGELISRLRHTIFISLRDACQVTPGLTPVSKKKLWVRNCLNLINAINTVIKGEVGSAWQRQPLVDGIIGMSSARRLHGQIRLVD